MPTNIAPIWDTPPDRYRFASAGLLARGLKSAPPSQVAPVAFDAPNPLTVAGAAVALADTAAPHSLFTLDRGTVVSGQPRRLGFFVNGSARWNVDAVIMVPATIRHEGAVVGADGKAWASSPRPLQA